MSENKIKKAVIYEDSYVGVIPAFDYCEQHNLTVVDFLKYDNIWGFNLNSLLKILEQQRGTIALVIPMMDSLKKTAEDDRVLHRLIQLGILELHFFYSQMVFNSENCSKETGYVQWTEQECWLNKEYKAKGYPPGVLPREVKDWYDSDSLPVGYRQDEKGGYYVDPIDGKVIKQLFTLYAEHDYSLDALLDMFNRLNWYWDCAYKKYSMRDLMWVLNNPVYYGRLKPDDTICEEMAITSKETFAKVQEKLMAEKSIFMALDNIKTEGKLPIPQAQEKFYPKKTEPIPEPTPAPTPVNQVVDENNIPF